jgi:hypothetical protein
MLGVEMGGAPACPWARCRYRAPSQTRLAPDTGDTADGGPDVRSNEMRTILNAIMLLMLSVLASGCASTGAYFSDRGRDAADILTLTIEQGVGVTAHAGPISTGLGMIGGGRGLDGGTIANFDEGDIELQLLILGGNGFCTPSTERPKKRGGTQVLFVQHPSVGFMEWGSHQMNPFKALLVDLYPPTWVEYPGVTQFDASVALGIGPRIGFNLMELIDFVCGWTTLDILGDDIHRRNRKEESNKESKATGKPAP